MLKELEGPQLYIILVLIMLGFIAIVPLIAEKVE
jgi:hypothetical protein